MLSKTAEAEAQFQRALVVARQQQALVGVARCFERCAALACAGATR
jgi:hypothetical protein